MAIMVMWAVPEELHEHGELEILDDLASHRGAHFLLGQSKRTLPLHVWVKVRIA